MVAFDCVDVRVEKEVVLAKEDVVGHQSGES